MSCGQRTQTREGDDPNAGVWRDLPRRHDDEPTVAILQVLARLCAVAFSHDDRPSRTSTA
jgi:hypothetical protein